LKLALPIVIMFCYATVAVDSPAARHPEGSGSAEAATEDPDPPDASDKPPPPSAAELLRRAVANLPRDPLLVEGHLIVRKWRGTVVSRLGFEMHLRWGDRPPTARYTVRDAFGAHLAELTVTRRPGQGPCFQYRAGNPPAAADLPDLYAPIGGSDVCWHDLALSFLWWEGGTVVRTDTVRGRRCYVLKVPAPACPDAPGSRYSHVLLWVDFKVHMLLQAEAYDRAGRLQRRLWVKSLKKVGDRWMIKDMEIEGSPRVHRTRLRVREVTAKPPL